MGSLKDDALLTFKEPLFTVVTECLLRNKVIEQTRKHLGGNVASPLGGDKGNLRRLVSKLGIKE